MVIPECGESAHPCIKLKTVEDICRKQFVVKIEDELLKPRVADIMDTIESIPGIIPIDNHSSR